jgi:hypothetical protein
VAQAYLATRISPHMARTADGFLICKDVCVARSGPLQYLASELSLPGGAQRVTVWRDPKEVSSRRFLASCEGAVVTDQHPGRFVDPGNFQVYAKGHAQNVRVGPVDSAGNVTTLADLFVNDEALAQKIESGAVRDVSIGYNLDVVKDEIGRWSQVNLRVNHIAVVPVGRAGSTRILDAAPVLDLAGMAALYLGRDVGSVKLPEHTALRTKVFDTKEETMPENKWKCSCGNINHGEADDCTACGKAYDDQEDLVPLEQTLPQKVTRDTALQLLRGIKSKISRQGTDEEKRAWNFLYSSIKDGQEPSAAMDSMRRQFGTSVSAADHATTDAQRSVDFVRVCADFLGKDAREVAAQRRTCRTTPNRAEQLFDTSPSDARTDFLSKVEDAREAAEKRWGY